MKSPVPVFPRLALSTLTVTLLLSSPFVAQAGPENPQPPTEQLAGQPKDDAMKHTVGLEQVAWLVGSWIGRDEGTWTQETWAGPFGGRLVGLNISGKEGKAGTRPEDGGGGGAFELLRVEMMGGKLVYLASPGGREPVAFTATSAKPGHVVFENADHDWPKRISYRLDPVGRLRVTVSGGDRSLEMSWQRGGGLPSADAMWNYGDPAGTRARFEALLEATRAQGPLGFDAALQIQTQIARTHSLAREFDAAHGLLDAVEAKLPHGSAATRVRYLLERGRSWNSAGDKDKARPVFEQAFELGVEAGLLGLAVDAAHMVNIVAPPGDDKTAWMETALALATAADAPPGARRWEASLRNNHGWGLFEAGSVEGALVQFEAAVPLREAAGGGEPLRTARWAVARMWRALGRVDEALAEQQALAAELAALGEADGFVSEELAENLLALKRKREAKPHFAAAYEALKDTWLAGAEPDRIKRMKKLGGVR